MKWRKGRRMSSAMTITMSSAHSPTLPPLYLRHSSFSNTSVASPISQLILQPLFRFFYVTGSSLTSLGEPPMSLTVWIYYYGMASSHRKVMESHWNATNFIHWDMLCMNRPSEINSSFQEESFSEPLYHCILICTETFSQNNMWIQRFRVIKHTFTISIWLLEFLCS